MVTGSPSVAKLIDSNDLIEREEVYGGYPEKVTVRIDGYQNERIFDVVKLVGDGNQSLNIDVAPSTTMRYVR